MSPESFIDEIADTDLVVTASFRCLALSVIFHKPFIAILTGDHGKDERNLNLLKIVGQESRILNSTMTSEDIRTAIDYDVVDGRFKPHLERSVEYPRRELYDEPDIPFDSSFLNRHFRMDSRCTGCSACASIYPCRAIAMKRNEEEFLVPSLDPSKCIGCYQCHSVCQVYSERKSVETQHYYAVKNSDSIRKESSSGGMFTALTEKILKDDGVVCGAAMDATFHVRHIIMTSSVMIAPMRGTYYVQSEIGDCYSRIKELLPIGTPVLVIGTGC